MIWTKKVKPSHIIKFEKKYSYIYTHTNSFPQCVQCYSKYSIYTFKNSFVMQRVKKNEVKILK